MDLIRFYRERLRSSPEFRELQEAFDGRTLLMMQARDDLFQQLHVDTATWGLELFEKAYGLPTSPSLSAQDRRARIKGKMQGVGITTIESIRRMASEYTNGDADVLELNRDYSFNVRLNSVQGLPPGLESLTAAIEELKPAHLAFHFVTMFRTHRELTPFRHCDLNGFNHKTLRMQTPLSWVTYKEVQKKTHNELSVYNYRQISLGMDEQEG